MRSLFTALVVAGCCRPPAAPPAPLKPSPVAAPVAAATAIAPAAVPAGPPIARIVNVVDHEFGLDVPDPYRWMEGTDNAELAAWLRAQGEHATAELAKLPGRAALHARIHELGIGVTAVWNVELAGGRLFHDVLPAGQQLAKLAVREPDGTERILVDPAFAGAGGAGTHASVNAYSASPDGKLVSYVIAVGGGEQGQLHVMDVASGKDLPDVIDRIWGEGAAAWLPDGKGFFYTQLAAPQAGVDPMLNQVSRLHVLGQPVARDATILGRAAGATLPLAPEEWPGVWAQRGTPWVVASIGGAHSEARYAIAKLSDVTAAKPIPWTIIADYSDGIESAEIHGDRIYLRTYKDAPNRRIVSVPIAHPDLVRARTEVPEDPAAALVGLAIARDALYVLHNAGGHAHLERWPWNAKAATPIALPVDGWVPDLASDRERDGLVFQLETWLAPGAYYTYDPKSRTVTPTGLKSTSSAVDPSVDPVVVDEVEAISADGTHVPLSILHAKDLALDGSHPTILSGYASYGVSQYPGFSATRLAWFERGGVLAVAHGRGGGEKGRRWQDDGSREHKLDGVHDFIACGEYLVAHHYTTPARLAAIGGSMGGVLIGRAITERPDLFAAANISVGIVNPLRILAAANGANQKAELGDPATEAGYHSILEMDPYTHVKSAPYPAVLFTIGLNDHRVAPWMTAKMAARLLASSTSAQPILIRVDLDAGHGIGSTRDQAFAERADVWSFFLSAFK